MASLDGAPAPSPPSSLRSAPSLATAPEDDEAINWIRNTSEQWMMSVLQLKKGLGLGLGLGLGCGFLIYPYGSYALGVPEEDEDDDDDDDDDDGDDGDSKKKKTKMMKNADLLCVGPRYVKPDDLSLLEDILLSKQEIISDVRWLPHPLVPRIEFTFRRLIYVHIIYASIALPFLPHDLDICDDMSVIHGVDIPTAMILDGCRTVRKLLRLVPHAHSFRAALRYLKLWAKRRAVYSSALGFLGDVSWALLLARICIDNPDASSPDTLLPLFFRTYMDWRWPDPLTLCRCSVEDEEEEDQGQDQDITFLAWNPQRNPIERSAPMPIITPVYPCMNSSRYVSTGTRQIMTEQFEAATRVCHQIHLAATGSRDWTLLFDPYPFFQAFDHYLQFTTACDSRSGGGDPREWKAGVESQLRTLTVSIELNLQGTLLCHPYPNDYTDARDPKERIFFAGLRWKEDDDDDDATVAPATTTTKLILLKRKRSSEEDKDDAEPPLAKRRSSTKTAIQEAFEQANEEVAAAAGKQRKRRRALLYESQDDIEPLPAKRFQSLKLDNS